MIGNHVSTRIIDEGQLLPASVAHDEAAIEFLNSPWWRETARSSYGAPKQIFGTKRQDFTLGIPSALNFFYALWRIVRLIGLWFDAKGSELPQRADRPRLEK